MELWPESDRLSSSWLRPRTVVTPCATTRAHKHNCDTNKPAHLKAHLVAAGRSCSLTGGRGRRRRGGDGFGGVRVGSVQPVGKAVIGVIGRARRVEVLHGAEIFRGHRLEGRRPKNGLDKQDGKTGRIRQKEQRNLSVTSFPPSPFHICLHSAASSWLDLLRLRLCCRSLRTGCPPSSGQQSCRQRFLRCCCHRSGSTLALFCVRHKPDQLSYRIFRTIRCT